MVVLNMLSYHRNGHKQNMFNTPNDAFEIVEDAGGFSRVGQAFQQKLFGGFACRGPMCNDGFVVRIDVDTQIRVVQTRLDDLTAPSSGLWCSHDPLGIGKRTARRLPFRTGILCPLERSRTVCL